MSSGRVSALLFSRLLNRFAAFESSSSPTRIQPKFRAGLSSHAWTSATRPADSQVYAPKASTVVEALTSAAKSPPAFAHVASLGIFVGGISAIAPSRRADLAGIGIYALLAATLATMMTGAIAGFYYNGESGILGL